MSKVAVIYWSGTGNTEAMANAVADGARGAGAEVVVMTPDDFDAGVLDSVTGVAFGCPAMGAETLEEEVFEPVFAACKGKVAGKPVALFGSYGWGDGEWMRTWEDDCRNAGISLACDSVICCEAPDGAAQDACKSLGAKVAE